MNEISNKKNVHVKVSRIIMARVESINIINMPMSKMDIAIKHRKSPHQNPQYAMINQA